MAEYDVIIIGSGPSGSVAAKHLVDKGLKVIILERKKMPRYKMCTGMLFPKAQFFIEQHYGKIPEDIFSHPEKWEGYKLFLDKKTPLEQCQKVFFPIPPLVEPDLPTGLVNTWRDRFDYWLAKQSNCELQDECNFRSFSFTDNEIKVNAVLKDKKTELTSKYVIGADGGTSMVRRAIFPDFDNKIVWYPCYEQWYYGTVNLDPNWFYGFLDPKFTGFYSCFYIKDDYLIQVTCGRKGQSIKQLHKNLFNHLKESHNLHCTEIIAEHGTQINDMAPRNLFCLGNHNVLLAGEAAGFLYPFGEGITPALITGEIAAKAIIEDIDDNENLIERYSKLLEEEKQRTIAAHNYAMESGMDVFRVNSV